MMAIKCCAPPPPPPPEVIVVGAGPSGLAASACLSLRGVPSLVLERDDCVGSLWRKRTYDRLTLHLPKSASALPRAPHAAAAPEYLPRDDFVAYLEGYADTFGVRARTPLRREVRGARFDAAARRWDVDAVDLGTGGRERYQARFLVVATGSYDERFVPEVNGLEGFAGEVVHACEYRSGKGMAGKKVLVVGCGNSGMEIALDLAENGALTSIVVRSEVTNYYQRNTLLHRKRGLSCVGWAPYFQQLICYHQFIARSYSMFFLWGIKLLNQIDVKSRSTQFVKDADAVQVPAPRSQLGNLPMLPVNSDLNSRRKLANLLYVP